MSGAIPAWLHDTWKATQPDDVIQQSLLCLPSHGLGASTQSLDFFMEMTE